MLKQIFYKLREFIKKIINRIITKIRNKFINKSAETYVNSGVKILIAVVIGALLLGLFSPLLENEIIFPVKEGFEEAFDHY